MLTLLNLANEQGRVKLMTSLHSELTALSSDINISHFNELPKIGENLIKRLGIKILAFSLHTQNTEHFISVDSQS